MRRMAKRCLVLATALVFQLIAIGGDPGDTPPLPTEHKVHLIEGWTVHVDTRLLSDENATVGRHALRIVENQLFRIRLVVSDEKVKRLQQVPIWLDLTCGELKAMQYHPSAGWLRAQGYSSDLAKCVHIPQVKSFINARTLREQPDVMLHELAHAYHDQELSFEHAEIKAAWVRFKESKKYESVLHIRGDKSKHYGLTTQMEFFAEMTEAYFGMNDFYPFNSAELKKEEPQLFQLLETLWGKPKR